VALDRVLEGVLAPWRSVIDVDEEDSVLFEPDHSPKYAIVTQFVRTVYSAHFSDEEHKVLLQPAPYKKFRSPSSHARKSISINRKSIPMQYVRKGNVEVEDLQAWAAKHSVFVVRDGEDKELLYCWLTEEEFEDLRSPAKLGFLADWMDVVDVDNVDDGTGRRQGSITSAMSAASDTSVGWFASKQETAITRSADSKDQIQVTRSDTQLFSLTLEEETSIASDAPVAEDLPDTHHTASSIKSIIAHQGGQSADGGLATI